MLLYLGGDKEKYIKNKDEMDCTPNCQLKLLSQTLLPSSKFYIPKVN